MDYRRVVQQKTTGTDYLVPGEGTDQIQLGFRRRMGLYLDRADVGQTIRVNQSYIEEEIDGEHQMV